MSCLRRKNLHVDCVGRLLFAHFRATTLQVHMDPKQAAVSKLRQIDALLGKDGGAPLKIQSVSYVFYPMPLHHFLQK